jgi:hypothetical protein
LVLLGTCWIHSAVAEHCAVAWFETPQASTVWHIGEEQLIAWTFVGPDQGCLVPAQVELALTRDGGQRELIAILPGDARSFAWNVNGPQATEVVFEFTRTYDSVLDDQTTYSPAIEIGAVVPAAATSWGSMKARFLD